MQDPKIQNILQYSHHNAKSHGKDHMRDATDRNNVSQEYASDPSTTAQPAVHRPRPLGGTPTSPFRALGHINTFPYLTPLDFKASSALGHAACIVSGAAANRLRGASELC